MNDLQRRSPSFWDDLHVPTGTKSAHLFTWLEETAPQPEEHDYVLSTDGSGCMRGWGASASIIQRVVPGGPLGRTPGLYQPIVQASYGSTVQRCEFTALLNGLHEILRIELAARGAPELDDDDPMANMRPLHQFNGDDRITVLWYTDRSNLAKSLLRDADGRVLNKRSTDSDLWIRFSMMAQHMCITPMWMERNTIPAQKSCDALCSIARDAIVDAATKMQETMGPTLHESWNKPRPQKATF